MGFLLKNEIRFIIKHHYYVIFRSQDNTSFFSNFSALRGFVYRSWEGFVVKEWQIEFFYPLFQVNNCLVWALLLGPVMSAAFSSMFFLLQIWDMTPVVGCSLATGFAPRWSRSWSRSAPSPRRPSPTQPFPVAPWSRSREWIVATKKQSNIFKEKKM